MDYESRKNILPAGVFIAAIGAAIAGLAWMTNGDFASGMVSGVVIGVLGSMIYKQTQGSR